MGKPLKKVARDLASVYGSRQSFGKTANPRPQTFQEAVDQLRDHHAFVQQLKNKQASAAQTIQVPVKSKLKFEAHKFRRGSNNSIFPEQISCGGGWVGALPWSWRQVTCGAVGEARKNESRKEADEHSHDAEVDGQQDAAQQRETPGNCSSILTNLHKSWHELQGSN